MEFNNLNPNILNLLHNERRNSKASETINTEKVFEAFSDIPAENIRDALFSMQRKNLIKLIPPGDKISLTRRGLSQQSIETLLRSNHN